MSKQNQNPAKGNSIRHRITQHGDRLYMDGKLVPKHMEAKLLEKAKHIYSKGIDDHVSNQPAHKSATKQSELHSKAYQQRMEQISEAQRRKALKVEKSKGNDASSNVDKKARRKANSHHINFILVIGILSFIAPVIVYRNQGKPLADMLYDEWFLGFFGLPLIGAVLIIMLVKNRSIRRLITLAYFLFDMWAISQAVKLGDLLGKAL